MCPDELLTNEAVFALPQNQDMEEELRNERLQRRAVQKRFAAEQETLPQQLASLKKKV